MIIVIEGLDIGTWTSAVEHRVSSQVTMGLYSLTSQVIVGDINHTETCFVDDLTDESLLSGARYNVKNLTNKVRLSQIEASGETYAIVKASW